MPSFICVTYEWWGKWWPRNGQECWRQVVKRGKQMLPTTALTNNPLGAIFWVHGSFFSYLLLVRCYKCYAVFWVAWNYTACSQEVYTILKWRKKVFQKWTTYGYVGVRGSTFTHVAKSVMLSLDLEPGKFHWNDRGQHRGSSSKGSETGRWWDIEMVGNGTWMFVNDADRIITKR